MSKFQGEAEYQILMHYAHQLLEVGIITQGELEAFECAERKRCKPLFGNIFDYLR